jgi:Magnesium transporter NIPA
VKPASELFILSNSNRLAFLNVFLSIRHLGPENRPNRLFLKTMRSLNAHSSENPDNSDSTGWASFIGIVICVCGNVIISFALNLQRLAHERIQRKLAATKPSQHNQRRQTESYGSSPSSTSTTKQDDETDDEDDEGTTEYLHSPLWWTGLVLMVIGECGNFIACMLSVWIHLRDV